jgi:hypothetical protein
VLRNSGWVLAVIPPLFYFLEPAFLLDSPGWVVLLHIAHLAFLSASGLFLYLTGRLVLVLAGLLPEDLLERLLLGGCAGFLGISVGLYALAFTGALHPALVWFLGICVCGGSVYVNPLPRSISRDGEEPLGIEKAPFFRESWKRPAQVAAWGLALVLTLLFVGSTIEALYPTPRSPDAIAWNLTYARIFSDAYGFTATPNNPLYFALTNYWELFLSAHALFTGSEITLLVMAQLFHLFLGLGGALLGIFCLARRLTAGDQEMRFALGLFATLLFAGMRIDVTHVRLFPFLIVAPKSDLIVTALQIGAALGIFMLGDDNKGLSLRGRAIFVGGLLGLVAGVKLTGGVAAIGLGVAFWVFPPGQMTIRERLRVTGWIATALVAVLVPLLAKNWLYLGNPAYPLLINWFGTFDNPVYFEHLSGFRSLKDPLAAAISTIHLLFPSIAFWILAGVVVRGVGCREVYNLLLASAVSVVTVAVVFSSNFAGRYILFLPAFQAVCTACIAGGLIDRFLVRGGRQTFSRYGLAAAWMMMFLLGVGKTHLDNRLKRAIKIAHRNPGLGERILQMSPASRFQVSWRGRLAASARPMTFYRPERLYALSGGWNPVVAFQSPSFVQLFTQEKSGAQVEESLAKKGITHFYFETNPEEIEFSAYYERLVAHLRLRGPLWRMAGYEMYAIKRDSQN